MPPKRKRNGEHENDEDPQVLRTPKKPRTRTSLSTPQTNRKRAVPKALSDDGDSEDEDELASAAITENAGRSAPSVTTPRRKRSSAQLNGATARSSPALNSTPTKSRSLRKVFSVSKTSSHHDLGTEEDLAAQLILDVQAEEASDLEEDNSSDADEENTEARSQGVSLQGGFEAYFEQAARKIKTSNNTLSKMPALSQSDYNKAIKDYSPPYVEALRDLYRSHVACFAEWSFELDQNYSLCLYGFGSKRSLIMEFVERESHEYGDPYVVVNGYHPNIDLRQICQSITRGLDSSGADVPSVLEAIDSMKHERLIIAFHNIDGPNLRSERFQTQLSRIVELPSVRLICSIDHINAPLLFSTSQTTRLSLLFHDATSFLPYTLETELQSDILSTSRKAHLSGDRGITWILQTLSKNAQTIFKLLLTQQLESSSGSGMESTRLFELASQSFAVSNQTSYHAILGEFLDHEVIVVEKESGIGEVLKIPYNTEELRRLLGEINEADAGEE